MLIRKPIAYALLVVILLLVSALGAYSVSAQTPTPPAQPSTQENEGFQPDRMMDAMAGMLDQMDELLAATDHPAHQQMAPAMIQILEGMQALNQPVTEQIHGQTGPSHEAQMQRMTEGNARMQALAARLHGMADHSAAPAPESVQPAPTAAQMQMGQQMQMMGMMMQMMGLMQSRMAGEMMGGESSMQGGQSMQPDPMQMGMMGQMMDKMGKGMMGSAGMGQMGVGSPVTATTTSPAPATGASDEQSVDGGGVTVKMTPLTLADASATALDFAVSLDTHTVELTYNLAQLTLLADNLGNTYSPAAWTPDKSDGHHVGGLLSFADRATILQEGVTELTLTVKDVAGVAERIFVWSVDQ